MAVIGPAQLCISIISFRASVAMLSHSVVLTLTTLQGERIAGRSVTIALTLSTDPFVDDVLQASVPISASLTREPGVTWGARTFLDCARPDLYI